MARATLQAQQVTTEGAKTSVENSEQVEYRLLELELATSSVSSVQLTLGKGLKAPFVKRASVTVSAGAPGRTLLAGVAQVRAAEGDATALSTDLVIDFQAQRTVSQISSPVEIEGVRAWQGTQFDRGVSGLNARSTSVTFPELQTERLLVRLATALDPRVLAQQGSVTIPTPPSNLELLVGNARVWFNAGPAVGPGGTPFSTEVTVTDAVASAAAAGQLPIVLTLRASVPGELGLTGSADILERYQVAFPEGQVRTVTAPCEGVYELSLPVNGAKISPDRADQWSVERVLLDLSAKPPETRVLPPDGPRLADGNLMLDPDHAFVVQLPPERSGQLTQLSGVRLPVSVGSDGAELAGILRSDATSAGGTPTPGDPIPKADLGPITLEAPERAQSAPTWIDLKLAQPYRLSGSAVWLELQVARGSLTWPLAEPQTNRQGDALVLRRTSDGAYVRLSTVRSVSTDSAAVRVVGSRVTTDPLPAVAVGVAGDTETAPVAIVPVPTGTTVKVNLARPAHPSRVDQTGDWELPLELTIFTAGSYAVSAAELQYRPAQSEG